jgi:hypothetical protein
LTQGELVAGSVEYKEYVAFLDVLVVLDAHLGDQTAYVRAHLNNVGANPTVAGPGLDVVVDPQPSSSNNGQGNHGERYADLT